MTLSHDIKSSLFLQFYLRCCQRTLILDGIYTFLESLDARRDMLQLDSEFKDGTEFPFLRETTDVSAKLLANYLAGV